MTIDIDELIKEVSIKHGFTLIKKDPVLITVALNMHLLKAYLDKANEGYLKANAELTVALNTQVEQAKETAGKLITTAAEYMDKRSSSSLEKAVDKIRTDLDKVVTEAGAELRDQIAGAAGQAAEKIWLTAAAAKTEPDWLTSIMSMAPMVAAITGVFTFIIVAFIK